MDETDAIPQGELTVRLPAMPADANANGDIFGGWVMSQMDLSAGIAGSEYSRGRVVTVAVNGLSFKKPVKIGDTLCVYSKLTEVGRTSMSFAIEAWVLRHLTRERVKVTEASFVMVAIDEDGEPRRVPSETPAA